MPPEMLASQPLLPGLAKAFTRLSNLDYPKYQPYYFALFDRVGTRVVWQSVQGGMIERLTHLRTDTIVSPDLVKEQLKISWYEGQAPGMWGKSNPKFDRSLDWYRQTCKGGTSHAINCADLKGPLPEAWRNDLWLQPVGINEWLFPLSKLTKNSKLAANLDAAIKDYLARERPRFQEAP